MPAEGDGGGDAEAAPAVDTQDEALRVLANDINAKQQLVQKEMRRLEQFREGAAAMQALIDDLEKSSQTQFMPAIVAVTPLEMVALLGKGAGVIMKANQSLVGSYEVVFKQNMAEILEETERLEGALAAKREELREVSMTAKRFARLGEMHEVECKTLREAVSRLNGRKGEGAQARMAAVSALSEEASAIQASRQALRLAPAPPPPRELPRRSCDLIKDEHTILRQIAALERKLVAEERQVEECIEAREHLAQECARAREVVRQYQAAAVPENQVHAEAVNAGLREAIEAQRVDGARLVRNHRKRVAELGKQAEVLAVEEKWLAALSASLDKRVAVAEERLPSLAAEPPPRTLAIRGELGTRATRKDIQRVRAKRTVVGWTLGPLGDDVK